MTDDESSKKDAAQPPKGQAQYTPEELKQIRAEFVSGKTPVCPQCQVAMTKREIGGGSFGLGYHRQREWLLCPSCKRSAIFDVKRGTRL